MFSAFLDRRALFRDKNCRIIFGTSGGCETGERIHFQFRIVYNAQTTLRLEKKVENKETQESAISSL